MKRHLFLFVLMWGYIIVSAQSLTTDVIATSGDYQSNESFSLSWTLGETITETFIQADQQFSQGFQQPYLYQVTGVRYPIPAKNYHIEVLPNPAETYILVSFDPDQARPKLRLMLFNAVGSKVFDSNIDPHVTLYRINIHEFPSNMFQMIIIDEERHFIKQFKIIKLNH